MSVSRTWGTSEQERELRYPGDELAGPADRDLYRGVGIDASPELVFRWLCQMRVAPHSYDWIDNLGRRSPRRRDPSLEKLELGQRFMTIFRLVGFERPHHLTLHLPAASRAGRLCGEIAVTYWVRERPGGCRLLAKLRVTYPTGWRRPLVRASLPWGDLIMMRRQLLNFKRLAEAEQRAADPAA